MIADELTLRLRLVAPGGFESGLVEGVERRPVMMNHRVLERGELPPLPAVGERPLAQRREGLAVEPFPRYFPLFQHPLADVLRLLGFALQLELAGLALPFLHGRSFLVHVERAGKAVELQQRQRRVCMIALDDVQIADRAGHGHVQRVDEELENLQRFVGLVASACVTERVALEGGRIHAAGDFAERAGLAGDEVVENDVFVLEPLGFLYREHQRGGEVTLRVVFLFRVHHDDRVAGRARGARIELARHPLVIREQTHTPALRPSRRSSIY